MLPRLSSVLDGAHPALTFFVSGSPESKGSTRAFVPKGWNRPVITSTNRNLKGWEAAVRHVASKHVRAAAVCYKGPIALQLDFILRRPKSLPKKIQAHLKKPDLDKITRAVVDGMTGLAYHDDSQVVEIWTTKRYVSDDTPYEGVIISIIY